MAHAGSVECCDTCGGVDAGAAVEQEMQKQFDNVVNQQVNQQVQSIDNASSVNNNGATAYTPNGQSTLAEGAVNYKTQPMGEGAHNHMDAHATSNADDQGLGDVPQYGDNEYTTDMMKHIPFEGSYQEYTDPMIQAASSTNKFQNDSDATVQLIRQMESEGGPSFEQTWGISPENLQNVLLSGDKTAIEGAFNQMTSKSGNFDNRINDDAFAAAMQNPEYMDKYAADILEGAAIMPAYLDGIDKGLIGAGHSGKTAGTTAMGAKMGESLRNVIGGGGTAFDRLAVSSMNNHNIGGLTPHQASNENPTGEAPRNSFDAALFHLTHAFNDSSLNGQIDMSAGFNQDHSDLGWGHIMLEALGRG